LLPDLDFFDGLVNEVFFVFEDCNLLSSLVVVVTFDLVLEEFAHLKLLLLFLDSLYLHLLLVQLRIMHLDLIPDRDGLMLYLGTVWVHDVDVDTISLFGVGLR
jgi:hypothetical protein